MNLLNKILHGSRAKKARRIIAQVAEREAKSAAKPEDPAALEDALTVLNALGDGYTQDRYSALVKTFAKYGNLEERAAEVEPLEKRAGELFRKIEEFRKESEILAKERLDRTYELMTELNALNSQIKLAHEAGGERNGLKILHPDAFGERLDLDEFTLVAGENIINPSDAKAPRLDVPQDVWQRECARRIRIMEAATVLKREQHDQAQDRWHKGLTLRLSGKYLNDDLVPRYEPPTWGEIVDRGWNRELDRDEAEAA